MCKDFRFSDFGMYRLELGWGVYSGVSLLLNWIWWFVGDLVQEFSYYQVFRYV